jgi:hypothetical protein
VLALSTTRNNFATTQVPESSGTSTLPLLVAIRLACDLMGTGNVTFRIRVVNVLCCCDAASESVSVIFWICGCVNLKVVIW